MRRRIAPRIVALLVLLAPAPSRAAVEIAAVPGSWLSTYGTPVVVWTPGNPLSFVNADAVAHDVASDETRAPGTASWCPLGGPRCPLFFADEISIGVTEVKGLHDITAGTYVFRCNPHTWMEGTLVVVS